MTRRIVDYAVRAFERENGYRENALVLVESAPEPRATFVRCNGSACTCTAPGYWWRRRVDVRKGDRWTCPHGGAWTWDDYRGKWEPAVKP